MSTTKYIYISIGKKCSAASSALKSNV
jgi:hypothetical protein